jgi:hypothetical protein
MSKILGGVPLKSVCIIIMPKILKAKFSKFKKFQHNLVHHNHNTIYIHRFPPFSDIIHREELFYILKSGYSPKKSDLQKFKKYALLTFLGTHFI